VWPTSARSIRPEDSLLSRLSERDRRDSEIVPGTPDGPFRLLYQVPGEALSEIRNATVQAYVCVALARTATGYRLYWAVYVLPVSWLTRPYLIAIEPLRRFILYPAMLRRVPKRDSSLLAALVSYKRLSSGHDGDTSVTEVMRRTLTGVPPSAPRHAAW
jgi:hypothetical protein